MGRDRTKASRPCNDSPASFGRFAKTEADGPSFQPMRTVREVASLLGIGRTRVVQLEQSALSKLRRACSRAGISSPEALVASPARRVGGGAGLTPKRRRWNTADAWLDITRIRSLNGGSEAAEDIVRAFRFLKESTDVRIAPPVLLSTPEGLLSQFRVAGLSQAGDVVTIRCWPRVSGGLYARALEGLPCTAIVESEFGVDDDGEFDVPLLICVIVSTRGASMNDLRERGPSLKAEE